MKQAKGKTRKGGRKNRKHGRAKRCASHIAQSLRTMANKARHRKQEQVREQKCEMRRFRKGIVRGEARMLRRHPGVQGQSIVVAA